MNLNTNIFLFPVDFNELILDGSIILFSRYNSKKNIDGEEIFIYEKMNVLIYMNDINNMGENDKLVSSGYIIRNPIFNHSVKWCCKLQTEIAYEKEDGNSISDLLSKI